MGAWPRSWWKKIKQCRVAIKVTMAIVVVAVALIIVYRFDWAGFNGYTQVSTIHTISGPTAGTVTRTELYQPGKTLWDWMQLLIVPLALALVALVFQRATTRTERQITQQRYENDQRIVQQRYEKDRQISLDKQQEDLLQAYLDRMSELLLKEKLRSSEDDAEVRNVARVRTITVLTQLDARRVGYIFAFLREARLMSTTSNNNVVILAGANFRSVNWSQAMLNDANLSYAFLLEAKLSLAILVNANLSYANLPGANLSLASLGYADLSHAYLGYANLSYATLNNANLNDANFNDANLSHAILFNADLSGADLSGADLSHANLTGAIVTEEQLAKAKSLEGATMPDGSKHS